MAVVIIATAGASNANSYATIAAADTYHEGHPYPETWDDADDDQKARALVTATRLLDLYIEWYGTASSFTQALGWPRIWAYNLNGYVFAFDEVPQEIINATAEFARQLLDANRMEDPETLGLKRLRAAVVELEWNPGFMGVEVLPDAVLAMVLPFGVLRNSRGARAIPLVRK